ncbi:MAG: hypothetical protein ACP5HJ_03185 [Candidatus Micrarchaeia archaeon]
MLQQALSDVEIKVEILNKLMRRGCWGAKYLPLDTLINWLSKKVKKDGKRIRKIIIKLVEEGYLLLHKNGKTISLNPNKNREIIDYIERRLNINL